MARFGFRKIINHYKNSKEHRSRATEQKFDAPSSQADQDVSCGDEIASAATELEIESLPSQEHFYAEDAAEQQPTAAEPQLLLDDFTLPPMRKSTREYRPNLNVNRSRSRRPKPMRQQNVPRRSCAICREREVNVRLSADGCICDRCNSTIRATFENFMDRSQRFQSGQQHQEEDNQGEQQTQADEAQRRQSTQSQPGEPKHLDKGQQAGNGQHRARQPIIPKDVPPFSIVVLQDCDNSNQLIEQLTSVLSQILPQQFRNASTNNNTASCCQSNGTKRSNYSNYYNASSYSNRNFEYNNNSNNGYGNDCSINRPLSPTNTCTCCPSSYYMNEPAATSNASPWQYSCLCDNDVAGSQQSSKAMGRSNKGNNKRKTSAKNNNRNRMSKANGNDDCDFLAYEDDDRNDCRACDCDSCKKSPENEMLLKLFVQVMEMFINSTKHREQPRKDNKSKKGKDGNAKDGSKKGKKGKDKSEGDKEKPGKDKQGKSKGKQNANGNTQINNSNRILPESDKQHARCNCPPECKAKQQQSGCGRPEAVKFKCGKYLDRVDAGDATKCGKAAFTSGNSGQGQTGLRPVAHYRPGVLQYPIGYLLAKNGECVRRSLVRTAAGATLHERVFSEVFTSSTNPYRKDHSRNAARCRSAQFSR
ncbi:PREDICTED: uncharacterized protein DDB_G0283357 isoform X1 [Drosophila arizonae]|uniref:Uncharacterized protein DDB_G0283357 isoform X1 n=1 Tax=Drosophila arizonae TaxID=7263 RepID=A0ABM1PNX0_DROAR|nr:PREDICTED: uncharacterized protein DDB_G0283357 isoform X1 [Drosophila arizonae]